MSDCPDWCQSPEPAPHQVCEGLLEWYTLPVVVTDAGCGHGPLLELNAGPADQAAVTLIVTDLMTQLGSGQIVITIGQGGDQLG